MKQITQKDVRLCREVLRRFSYIDRESVISSTFLRFAPSGVICGIGLDMIDAQKIRSFVTVMGSLGVAYFYYHNARVQEAASIVYDVFAIPSFPLVSAIDIEVFNSALCRIFGIKESDFLEVPKK